MNMGFAAWMQKYRKRKAIGAYMTRLRPVLVGLSVRPDDMVQGGKMINHNPVWPSASLWGCASLFLIALAGILFYLVDVLYIFNGLYLLDLGFTKENFLAEVVWDGLLFLAYIAGRLGWQTPMGKVGVGLSTPLFLFDMLTLMPFTVSELAHYSR